MTSEFSLPPPRGHDEASPRWWDIMDAAPQGGRQAAGLGLVGMVSALTTIFRPLVKAPVSAYLAAMGTLEDAGVIPDILEFAEITRETAEDALQYGSLRGDPLPVDGIAFALHVCIFRFGLPSLPG